MATTDYFPDRRLAYDEDGTRIFYRRAAIVNFPNAVRYSDYTELQPDGLRYLNSDRRYSLSFGIMGDAMSGNPPFLGAWEVVVVFPRPMDLSGIFFASGQMATRQDGDTTSSFERPALSDSRYAMSTSKDTTSLGDGTWSKKRELFLGTDALFDNTTENRYPFESFSLTYAQRWRAKYYRADKGDSYWGVEALDIQGPSRTVRTPENPRGIQTITDSDFRGIIALRIFIDSDDAKEAFGTRNVLHLYGMPSLSALEPWDRELVLVRPDGSELKADDLEFGDLSADYMDGPTLSFRIKNTSPELTAEDVTLTVTVDEDQNEVVFATPPASWPEYWMNELVASARVVVRINGGAWVQRNTVNPLTLPVGTLAPGELSEVIDVRLQGNLSGGYNRGIGSLLALPAVGAWS